MLKPRRLQPGARVSIVAPAGPFDRPTFEAGLAILRERYTPVFDDGIFASERYLAGGDDHRLKQLEQALGDPSTEAVFCVRGGYGVMRILHRIDVKTLTDKPLIGFSDITALHALWQSHGRVSIHGPVLTQLGRMPRESLNKTFSLLERAEKPAAIRGSETYVPGMAQGRLLGGNLSVLTRLLGTPYLPNLTGAVLLIEDVGERPYRLDRMWTHLRLAGAFQQVRGIVLGEFTGCDEKDAGYGSADILRELAKQDGIPCAAGFPIGHGTLNDAVALGCEVKLDASAQTLEFLEVPTAERSRA